jgi:type VI secretion system secreted protein Hcp
MEVLSMKSGTISRRQVLMSAGAVLMLVMLFLVFGGGKVIASSFAVLLSGSSTQGTRLDGIEVLSWSHGVSAPREAGSGLATGRRQYQPLIIRKRIDKASPLLYRALGQTETFPSLKIAINEPGATKGPTLTITLTNAQVTEIVTGDVDGDGAPDEQVSFVFEKIEWSANGVTYQDTWAPAPVSSPPTYGMAINEKGLPGRPKKQTQVSAYRTQIISPRDAASGLPTGKRQHSPFQLVVPNSGETPELTQAFLTGRPVDMVSVMTYGADGQPTGAVSLLGVRVVSMTETRRTYVVPHVLESSGRLNAGDGSVVSNPLYEASQSDSGMDCFYELTYQKIQWLDAAGGVTHEDTWDSQR